MQNLSSEVRRIPLPRTRVNYRGGPGFSNVLPIERSWPHRARQGRLRSSATSEGPGVLPVLTSHHAFRTLRAPSPYPPLLLCRQNTSAIRDRLRGPCDALIYFLRFIRFSRSNLRVKTSDWGRWLHQVNAAHAHSKSSTKLLSLCSTQPHRNRLFVQVTY
jgi:hypothetical protein